jgi:aryl-alcohol dehydrogenase-like predicted oxidoreductase
MGVGCGGPSRVGQRYGKSEDESASGIRRALDSDVNFIDTAEAYKTEGIVGKAIKGMPRDRIVISTKKRTRDPLSEQNIIKSLEASLKLLGTDYIDIYHFHGVGPDQYVEIRDRHLPVMQKLRDQGKIRFIGITEMWNKDPQHRCLQQALEDEVWDVMMVGFNILNQSARDRVFRATQEKNIGVLNMFAVRRALSQTERLVEILKDLQEQNLIGDDDVDLNNPGGWNPLGFLVREGGAKSIPDAAYRFCRYEPGIHVVLSGTGNPDHLEANLSSLSAPPLPPEDVERLKAIFEKVDNVTGQ